MLIPKGSLARVVVRLFNWSDVANELGTKGPIPVHITAASGNLNVDFIDAAGTRHSFTPSDGVNWFALDDGVHQLIPPSGSTDVVGPLTITCSDVFGGATYGNRFAPAIEIATVVDFAALVWDATRSAHVASGTYGELARLLKQAVAGGRVKIDPVAGSITVYSEDGTTPLLVQNLTDVNGSPAGLNAVERR